MKVDSLISRVFITKILLLISVSTVVAEDGLFSKIVDSADTIVIEQCVKNVNQTADDVLDTAARLYHTGMCHFCATCDLKADNGQLFLVDTVDSSIKIILSTQAYKTAHKLISQATVLDSREAFYGLAVLQYALELGKNRQSEIGIADSKNITLGKLDISQEQNKGEIQDLNDNLVEVIFKKSHKTDFSSKIYEYLLVAAKSGYVPAQFAISEVYFKGIGVIPDEVQAYAWAATAVAQNPPFGSQRRDEKAVNLDNIELNEAESFAEEYIRKYTDIFDHSPVTVMR